MICSSESNVNNWWDSAGPMKGIYQGNEFDVKGPPCKKKKKKKKKFFFHVIHRTAKKYLVPTEGQMVMPKLHYTMTVHSFQEILIVRIYWDLMGIIFQIYYHP